MIIKNYNTFRSHDKKLALQILESGLCAAMPDRILSKIVHKNMLCVGKNVIRLSDYDGIFVVAFGKAADSMANIVAHLTHITGGLVVIPKNTASLLKNNNFKILKAGHPLPDKSSVSAAKTIIKFLQARKNNDYVIFLISGGGSSLVALPDGITLSEKKKTTKLLLDCGADIHEINCIRKHISKIKGGWMSEYLKCDAISLVMSDVVGNDISSIASGPTYFDKTTFDDAKKILKKYNLEKSVPKNVLKRIVRGMKNKIPETPKHPKIKNYVIATNGNCLDEMKKTAKKFGLRTSVVSSIDDDVKLAARKLIAKTKPNSCLVFGGETTVKVTGHGKGGRNQELVLYASIDSYKKNHKTIIASIGTDGKDGNTNACGAMLENSELKIGETQKFLKNNNSYSLLKKHNALVFTGQTHTNLMDIGVILRK